ncbi:4237_t:CDS:1, partial [Racocetra persica]
GDQKASVRFQQRQQELLKQKQKSLVLMIGDNGNYDTRTTQQFPNIVNQVNELDKNNNDNDNSSQKISRVPSSPTLERYAPDCTIITPPNKVTPKPRTSSLSNNLVLGIRRIKTYDNLKTDAVEM